MIKGTTTKLSTYGNLPSSQVTSSSLIIYPPTGDTIIIAPTVEGLKLTAQFTPAMAGIYRIKWEAQTNEGSFLEVWAKSATYYNILTNVLAQLQLSEVDIDIQLFEQLLAGNLAYWLNIFSEPIPDYNTLSIADQILFDTAMSMVMWCVMKPYVASSEEQTGEIASIGTGPDAIAFHRRYAAISLDQHGHHCLDEAWRLFNSIEAIGDWTFRGASFQFFATAGRRKAIRKKLGHTEYDNPLYNLYGDAVIDYMYNGGFFYAEYA